MSDDTHPRSVRKRLRSSSRSTVGAQAPVRRRRGLIAAAVVLILLAGGVVVAVESGAARTAVAWFDNRGREFPAVDAALLDPLQRRIVEVTRTEFDAQHPGTHFSEGIEEDWCADFVSWVMHESGRTFDNPHSGHWRIPGVYTLTEYFQAQNRFRGADSGYRPKLGDVMLYSTDSHFGQHTNIVLAVDGDDVTTVGGNEWGGHVRISEFTLGDDPGLVGFGVL